MTLIFFIHQKNTHTQDQLLIVEHERYEMNKVADRLHQSSDDLTRFARTYVVTGNEIYKTNYYKVLDIRNGKAPRPKHYESIYWDYMEPLRSSMHPDEKPISLNQIINSLPFTAEEKQKLDLSHLNSDDLVNLEEEAFHLMVGRFKDAQGNYTIQGKPDQQSAIKLLHSRAYHLAKQKIMQPIDEFILMLNKRTSKKIGMLQHTLQHYEELLGYVIGLFIIVNLLIFIVLHKRIIRVISYMIDQIRHSRGNGLHFDLSKTVHEDELKTMMAEFNTMQSIINKRTQLLKEANEELAAINLSLEEKVKFEVAERLKVEGEKITQEKLLVQQSKMAEMGEMLGVIIHQWKQPLNAIALTAQNIELVNEDFFEEPNKDLTEIEESIVHQVVFMSDTMNYFRNFFMPTDHKTTFRACEVINEIKTMFSGAFAKKDVRIEIADHKHFDTFGKKNEFSQVILNILTNAKDALLANEIEDKLITCHFESNDQYNIIKIKDNAKGIPDELLPDKLFEPYVTTKGEKGTGIGLQISKMIIEHNFKGKIWAHNVDGSAEFVIELPVILNEPEKKE